MYLIKQLKCLLVADLKVFKVCEPLFASLMGIVTPTSEGHGGDYMR